MANQQIELSTIISFLAMASAFVLGVMQLAVRPRQAKAHDDLDFTAAAKEAVELAMQGYKAKIQQMEELIQKLQDEIKERDDYIDRLIDQLVKAGIVPVDRKHKRKEE